MTKQQKMNITAEGLRTFITDIWNTHGENGLNKIKNIIEIYYDIIGSYGIDTKNLYESLPQKCVDRLF